MYRPLGPLPGSTSGSLGASAYRPAGLSPESPPSHVRRLSGSSSGFGLAEVLVAACLFVVVLASAMVLYSGATRAYRSGEAQTLEQQNLRAAFDRMISEIK